MALENLLGLCLVAEDVIAILEHLLERGKEGRDLANEGR